jgi:hypothetical protein
MVQFYGLNELKRKKFLIVFREPMSAEFSWYSHNMRECINHMNKIRKEAINKDRNKKNKIELTKKKGLCDSHMCSRVGCPDRLTLDVGEEVQPSHLFSFREWVEKGGHERAANHYLDHLKTWEKIVGRERIFVMKFDDLVKQTSMVSKRLAKFLDFERDWGNISLPHSNDASHLELTVKNCDFWHSLQAYYIKANKGLEDYISNHPKKPPMEPIFTPFVYKDKCEK